MSDIQKGKAKKNHNRKNLTNNTLKMQTDRGWIRRLLIPVRNI